MFLPVFLILQVVKYYSLILKAIPMVWYSLEELTDYCCSENIVLGMVIATSSQKDTVLFIIIGLDSSEYLWHI